MLCRLQPALTKPTTTWSRKALTSFSKRPSSNRVDGMLIYSTEVDVYDSTKVRNERKHSEQTQLRARAEAHRETMRRVQLDEATNISVALPYVYGEGVDLMRRTGKENVAPDKVLIDGGEEAGKEEDEAPVYPYNLFHDVSERKRLGRGRRPRRRAGRRALEEGDFEAIAGNEDKEASKLSLVDDDLFRYGTADPAVAASKVPCGGCGAHLHCQDTKAPGFVPSEQFVGKSEKELRLTLCQRCDVMEKYNVALKVSVAPDFYPRTIEHISRKRAIVLLVVDLLDYPGSVWPGIVDLLGPNKKIILVGNKVDMLPQDSANYLTRVERVMKMVFMEKCSRRPEAKSDPAVVSTCLVSARTGYNIERLIDMVYTCWSEHNRDMPPTDVYLVGSTNVGKSSIFNHLLSSDMCKVDALNKVQGAMISPVPGTTLNLLKFPIMRPDPSRIHRRHSRLRIQEKVFTKREKERLEALSKVEDRREALLRGHVGQTFAADKLMPLTNVGFDMETQETLVSNLPERLDPKDPLFADGRWCYDTPGTVCNDQVINLLTQEEIAKVISDLPLRPRCFNIRGKQTIFLSGLGRLDVYGHSFRVHPMRIVVFCSDDLPIHIVRTSDADEFYSRAKRSGLLGVPFGSEERLADFPPLAGQTFEVDGVAHHEASCEIVFGSAGWISCVPRMFQICRVTAWTPGGRGLYVRDPPFLPYAHLLRGSRIPGTPAYGPNKNFSESEYAY